MSRVSSGYSTPDSYSHYLTRENSPVSLKDYRLILGEFFKFIMKLVHDGNKVSLPNRLGHIYVRGRKIKPMFDENGNLKNGLAPDWVKTKALRESNEQARIERRVVYHLNEHTQGIRYKIKWSKAGSMVENINFYSLVFSRTNKRKVNELIVKERKEYIVEKN